MIPVLTGSHLPAETQGRSVPALCGDMFLDVPGLPLQIGYSAVLDELCGIDPVQGGVIRVAAPDWAIVAPLINARLPWVAQLDDEWVLYTGVMDNPPRMIIATRGYGLTTAVEHGRGTTVYFVEPKPWYAHAWVPPGHMYPSDAVMAARVSDQTNIPPCTIRLQDTRVMSGHRFITTEFDLARAFYGAPIGGQTNLVVISGASDAEEPRMPPPISGGVGVYSGPFFYTGPFFATKPTASAQKYLGTGKPQIAVGLPPPPAPPPPAPKTVAPKAVSDIAGTVDTAAPQPRRILSLPLGRVALDLKGLLDRADGHYTGTAFGPMIEPAPITRLHLKEVYSETSVHEPTLNQTRAEHKTRGIVWRSRVGEDPNEAIDTFRAKAGFAGNCDFFLDDNGQWRYQYRSQQRAVVTELTERELIGDIGLKLRQPSNTKLQVSWGQGLQSGSFSLENNVAKNRYGSVSGRTLVLDYCANEKVARRIAGAWLAQWSRQKLEATAGVAYVGAGLALTDRILLDMNGSVFSLYGQGKVPYEIRGLTDGDFTRSMVLLECDPLAEERTIEWAVAKSKLMALPFRFRISPARVIPLTFRLLTMAEKQKNITYAIITGDELLRNLTFAVAPSHRLPLVFMVRSETSLNKNLTFAITQAGGEDASSLLLLDGGWV